MARSVAYNDAEERLVAAQFAEAAQVDAARHAQHRADDDAAHVATVRSVVLGHLEMARRTLRESNMEVGRLLQKLGATPEQSLEVSRNSIAVALEIVAALDVLRGPSPDRPAGRVVNLGTRIKT